MPEAARYETVGTPLLWAASLVVLVVLLALDFLITRRPHEVRMREALLWSAFYVALPLVFWLYLWWDFGTTQAVEFLTGYVVEKSLSVDNLFVFMLLLSAFAVPPRLQQRVLLYGIIGALVLRGIFIALGAAMLYAFDWTFLVFGAILVATAVKIFRDALSGEVREVDVSRMRSVRLLRRLMPVTDDYRGPEMTVREGGRRALTPLALVVVAVFVTDVVFAVDSVPAVFGITEDPFLVFTTNAFALLGLRALYFVLQGAVSKLAHLDYGLALILAFIGVKLALHWAHDIWPVVPDVPTWLSMVVIVLILGIVTMTSLWANRLRTAEQVLPATAEAAAGDPPGAQHPRSRRRGPRSTGR
ncbi:TerC/Alx family metal homeostasis membrane protein [Longimycelium tulufanense]|nr:TerC/Alx family metal homeostasis membrane protein [Longimycelium tulufanense]